MPPYNKVFTIPDSDSMPEAKHRRDFRKGSGSKRFFKSQYTEDNIGVKGEMAFSILTGLKMNLRMRAYSDGGIDFRFTVFSKTWTIDVKTARTPFNLLVKKEDMKKGKCADYLVLAGANGDVVTFYGWSTRPLLRDRPVREFKHGILSHYLGEAELFPIERLLKILTQL